MRSQNRGEKREMRSTSCRGMRATPASLYLSADGATTISLFQMYEFHTTQSGTHIRPGKTFDLDYSVMRTFPF
jgi:hypothetical protein